MRRSYLKSVLAGSASVAVLASGAYANEFSVPSGDLRSALNFYAKQARVELIYPVSAIEGVRTRGARGNLSSDEALAAILKGTGFGTQRTPSGAIGIVRATPSGSESVTEIAQTGSVRASAGIESVVVTSSKIKGDIQTVPIAITALSQEELTARQIAGGPDLVKEVPNLTFSKTNFTGYNLQIRGIGTQAISVTTDPAVAVAFNDTPFIRNHFFEQEFFDVSQVEILRGPQGTLYGRNATAGVVNVVSAKPTDQFEAMLSADWGNYSNRRYEGMVNLPIVGDKLALRIAGEWTKRDGYSHNEITNSTIDGRDLWSSRVSLRWRPVESVTTDLIWEHFQESDDRIRSGKQLCKTDPGPSTFTAADGTVITVPSPRLGAFLINTGLFSQGCLPNSIYDKGDPAHGDYGSFGVPNGYSLGLINGLGFEGYLTGVDPYAAVRQSTNLRDIQSVNNPIYKANNDTLEFNAAWQVTPALTFSSETAYNRDFLWSTEDFNRFNTSDNIFLSNPNNGQHLITPNGNYVCHDGTLSIGSDQCSAGGHGGSMQAGYFCDPQLGCTGHLLLQDLSEEHSWQFSQELRLASDFEGPLNFSAGGNYLHYETGENYYVFSNALTLISLGEAGCQDPYVPGVTTDLYCLNNDRAYHDPHLGGGVPTESPQYTDPNPLTNLDNNGHNYFLSNNPYVLNSYAVFGEAYYNITPELKLTGGLRWTDDQKHFIVIPSEVIAVGYGYPSTGTVDKSWTKYTGRAVVNWTPKLDFTDQTMVYASFSHGYKAGGQNPPGPVLTQYESSAAVLFPIHPLDFQPEYIDAYEVGTKNTALDGRLVFNFDAFYYNYKGYQISQIVDRTSININVDATVQGAEIQATYAPLQGLKFGFNGGYEDTRIKDNQYFIDLMDRTYGHHDDWTIMKPWLGESSNCVFPDYVAATLVAAYAGNTQQGNYGALACGYAYTQGIDPVTLGTYNPSWGPSSPGYATYNGTNGLVDGQPYFVSSNVVGTGGQPYGYPITLHDVISQTNPLFPPVSYPGFDPASASVGPHGGANGGEGFAKPIGGNTLPNAPHFTASFTADYTMPVSADWAATLHSDFYWQSQSWARIFNDPNYDKIRGYANVNLALILTDASGWQVMGYVKNIFDTTAITGTFLNSDDTSLTTNVFLTDPRLYGVRITKNFEEGSAGSFDLFSNAQGSRPQIWLTVGGDFNAWQDVKTDPYDPLSLANFPNGGGATPPWQAGLPTPASVQKTPRTSFDWEGSLVFQPSDSDWKLKAGVRYGRSSYGNHLHKSQIGATRTSETLFGVFTFTCTALASVEVAYLSYTPNQVAAADKECRHGNNENFIDAQTGSSEKHGVLDFDIGKDIGIGIFNRKGTGTLSAGVRIAQFSSRSDLVIGAQPYYHLVPNKHDSFRLIYDFYSDEKRSFHGMGPEVSWDASQPVWGSVDSGQVAIDWGVNLGVLFGEQRVSLHHTVKDCQVPEGGACQFINGSSGHDNRTVEPADDILRSTSVTVPNLGAHLGLSVNYENAKVSFGYRADEFFKAMDGGEWTRDRMNRGFDGAYVNLSLGLGG